MDKKKILIIVGVVAVVGIGLYMWNKSKKTSEDSSESDSEDTEATANSTATKSANANAGKSTTTAKAPLNTRKEKKKACGRRPISKKKRAEWQKCVDAGGVASFMGDFDDFQYDYIDFEGQIDNQFMFSEIESHLDLDI